MKKFTFKIIEFIFVIFLTNLCYIQESKIQSTATLNTKGVPVLIYHEIVTDSNRELGETVISLEKFKQQMAYLASQGYKPISMKEFLRYLNKGGSLPDRSIVLNFDDGWLNALNAVPVLEKYSFPASFWIISGPKGIGKGEYMEWSDIIQLSKNPLFEIGSHTYSHPWNPKDNLVTWVDNKTPSKGNKEALFELKESKRLLETQLGIPIDYLAWPCGWYNERLIELAKISGYKALLTTEEGANKPGSDPFRIKRIFIDGKCELSTFKDQLENSKYIVCQKSQKSTRGNSPYALNRDGNE
ncbi:MAG: polysaccharide deacetylase family protein [Leptospiraceae bacterium]|nr:polysaccharide deacetylase family protein [Leptospiraceae bacterium]MCZ8345532.1 polysaccharide deacetylase family protein [Leptospiraceae bacterium]